MAGGQGISTAGLPGAPGPEGHWYSSGGVEQKDGPGAGAPGAGAIDQAPQSGSFGPPQGRSGELGLGERSEQYNAPLSTGAFGYPPQPTYDGFGQPPLSGQYSNVQPPSGTFSNTPVSQSGFGGPPPGAAPYAGASYAGMAYPMPYGYQGARPAKLRDGMAITSLVLGCLSPFSCAIFGIGSIVGIVLGIVATVKAQRYPAEYGGKAMAIIGIVLNGFSMIIVVPIVLAIAVPNMLASRMAANEASAIATLRSIGSAEATYQSTVTGGKAFGNLDQLVETGFVAKDIKAKHGYRFEVRATENRTRSGSEYWFEAFATPDSYNLTGKRSFYLNQQFVIRAADKFGRQAAVGDPPLDSNAPRF